MIKGPRPSSLLDSRLLVEAVASFPPLVGTGFAIWAHTKNVFPGVPVIRLLQLVALWLVATYILKVVHAGRLEKLDRGEPSYAGFEGALHAIYHSLAASLTIKDSTDGRLRMTILRVEFPDDTMKEPQTLEQMLPYLGGKGGDRGRKFSIRSGISGRVAREGKLLVAKRTNSDQHGFINEMVTAWNYTETEAKSLTQDRQSWMAVPIMGRDQKVVAVVYLDSIDRKMFTKTVQVAVLGACNGVATYIRECYR